MPKNCDRQSNKGGYCISPKKWEEPSKPISVVVKEAFIPAKASRGAIAPLPSCRKIVETIRAEKDNRSPN